jgi:hypothetical protein
LGFVRRGVFVSFVYVKVVLGEWLVLFTICVDWRMWFAWFGVVCVFFVADGSGVLLASGWS